MYRIISYHIIYHIISYIISYRIIYHIISYIIYIISYIIYHIIYHIVYHIISYHIIKVYKLNDVNNQQDATTFSFINLFNSILHVSGDKFAHPQEHFLTVYTAFGTMHRHCCRPLPRLRWNSQRKNCDDY